MILTLGLSFALVEQSFACDDCGGKELSKQTMHEKTSSHSSHKKDKHDKKKADTTKKNRKKSKKECSCNKNTKAHVSKETDKKSKKKSVKKNIGNIDAYITSDDDYAANDSLIIPQPKTKTSYFSRKKDIQE